MEWTDIRLTVVADADNAEAVATMIAEGGIYIEDYSDIEQQVAEIAHVDLIEQDCWTSPAIPLSSICIWSRALPPWKRWPSGRPHGSRRHRLHRRDRGRGAGGLAERLAQVLSPLEIGKRLAVVPSWQQYDTDRVKLILTRACSGTGGHETTSLCMEALDERVTGGSGCWISAPAAASLPLRR